MWWALAAAALVLALAFGASAVVLAYAGLQTVHAGEDCWTNQYCA
jgi:hypothetical protein